MTWTNLDYVQHILSSLDSDEVNTVNDTPESTQVLRLLQQCYEQVVARADLSEHYNLFELLASGDNAKPTIMYRPGKAMSIEWIKYNAETVDDTKTNFRTVKFLPIQKFIEMTNMFNETETNYGEFTHTVDGDSLTFKYRSDKSPDYYTTPDDSTLLFDSYDEEVDTTLQATKSLAYGKLDQSWADTDTFVPFIDKEFAMLLLNDTKALAFAELKQVGHDKAERESRRFWTDNHKKKRSVDRDRSELDRLPNYGRK